MITVQGNKVTVSLGLPLLAITAFLAFLKACGLGITWFWVFSPLWIPFAIVGGIICLFMGCIVIFFVGLLIAVIIDHYRNK